MDELFNLLSSAARIDKSKRKKKSENNDHAVEVEENDDDGSSHENDDHEKARDRTGKRDTSRSKQLQIHKEQVAAFRRSLCIKVANKHDRDLPDPISSFSELGVPEWWRTDEDKFKATLHVILRNIEAGKWKEPTPIQMQSIPCLMRRRDVIGCAPTGSGKSGAFLIPAILLGSAESHCYHGTALPSPNQKTKKKKSPKVTRQGEIRSLILAPSLELASQLHREVERLGLGKPGGLTSLLLSKSNVAQAINGEVGGKNGLDVLVSTPLRVVDAIEKGLRLDSVRIVVLDEADRLLDAADGSNLDHEEKPTGTSGSAQSRSFLSQMDVILSQIPSPATRALFSATVSETVRTLAETILRNPVDVNITTTKGMGGANPDIEQKLMFVGREEGKLLAIRQLVQRGELTPPALIFLQSQERAQALFGELLYDGIHVDVIHAGRSKSARENAVAKFRRGDTWVLICTDLVARGVDFRAVKMVINYDLPASGVTYVHRIGRTGRAGRKGKAITLFTEADFENLRTIANVMKQSGCEVDEWMLNLSRPKKKVDVPRKRSDIDTTPKYDRDKKRVKRRVIEDRIRKQEGDAAAKQRETSEEDEE